MICLAVVFVVFVVFASLGLIVWAIVDGCRVVDNMAKQSPPTTSLDDALYSWPTSPTSPSPSPAPRRDPMASHDSAMHQVYDAYDNGVFDDAY